MRRRSPLRPQRGSPAGRGGGRDATARRTLPRLAITLGRELRWALGDEGVGLADEGAALDRPGEDDLAAAAERVRDRARGGDRQRLSLAVAIDDREGDAVAALLDRPLDDAAGHLVAGAGRGGEGLRGVP